jgi:hypothetical protein
MRGYLMVRETENRRGSTRVHLGAAVGLFVHINRQNLFYHRVKCYGR